VFLWRLTDGRLDPFIKIIGIPTPLSVMKTPEKDNLKKTSP
jgi:hypothetical protein